MTICIGIAALFTGCDEDPLQSLKNDQVSTQFSERYWDQQFQYKTTLWQKALAVCKDSAYQDKPNCEGIRDIEMFSEPSDFPTYGSGKGFGQTTLPSEKQ